MDNQLIIASLAILALLVIAVILRYKRTGEAEFFIGKWVKFRFKGSNQSKTGDEQSVQPKLPKLKIELFQVGRTRTYDREIAIRQNEGQAYNEYKFGVVLENNEPIPAKGIGIEFKFSWRGNNPKYSLKFSPPRRAVGWSTSVAELVNGQSAVLIYSGAEQICFPEQPVEWLDFLIKLQERLNGYILLEYKVSSLQPPTNSSGELKIFLN